MYVIPRFGIIRFGVSRCVQARGTAMSLLAVMVIASPAGAGLYDDFEDGDHTANPTWFDANPGYGQDGGIVQDPLRPDNLIWKARGTPAGADRAIGTMEFDSMS